MEKKKPWERVKNIRRFSLPFNRILHSINNPPLASKITGSPITCRFNNRNFCCWADDGATFHKSCFKCSHCKGTLVMSNYSSMDGVLYCKPHFEQLFKESGNFSKNFQSSKPERENSLTRAPSKLSAMFSGTQDKCPACSKTVYPLEKVTMGEESFHKSCFKCAHGGCPLTHSSYAALDGILYCKVHFQQLFMEKGNYQHVLDAAHRRTASMEAAEAAAAMEAESQMAELQKVDEEAEPKPEAETETPQEQS